MTRPLAAVSGLQAPSGRFLIQATLWSLVLFGMIRLPWVASHVVGGLISLQTTLLSWYGAQQAPNLIVNASCSGADVAAICLSVTLAYPVAWRRRLIGAAVGTSVILAVNAVRLASLFAVASDRRLLDLLHLYVWPAALSLVTVLYILGWIRWNTSRRTSIGQGWVRFFQVAAVGFVVYAALAPWALTSPALARVGGWTAVTGGALLTSLGATVQTQGAVLMTERGGFLVTQECLFTPMLPLFIAAVLSAPMPRRRRWAWLAAAPAVFFLLGVARLLALALPPFVIARPTVVVHGFYQLVAAVVAIVVAAHYAMRRETGVHASKRAALALTVAVAAGILASGTWSAGLSSVSAALARILGTTAVPLASVTDQQGALLLMPGYQVALVCGLWVALIGGRRSVGLAAALGWLAAAQVVFLVGTGAVLAAWGLAPHAVVVRGFSLAAPVLLALTWTTSFGTTVGDQGYWRFWQDVGDEFPVLTGAASTRYYADNERRLIAEALPDLTRLRLLKTDLWDEAKNTRILQWAADQGARVVGVDLSAPIVREARAAFDERTLRAAVGDVRRLPFADASMDAIYSMGTVEHFAETEQSIVEIARVLRPGGRLILGVPNRHDPFLRPLMVAGLHLVGLYGYGYEKSYSRRALRQMVEGAGLRTHTETAILFMPGWLRMLDLWCFTRARPLARVTAACVGLFVWIDRHVPAVRRHGYLIVNVSDKPPVSGVRG